MQKRLVICFFGVISRSIRYTFKNFKKNLIDILSKDFHVDIYIFNNNVEKCKVDNKYVNNGLYNMLNPTFFEEKLQKHIDAIILETIKSKNINCNFKYYGNKSNRPRQLTIKNCIRQMYSEEQVGLFLEKNKYKYDCAVVCGPDYYLIKQINLEHVKESINNKSIVYTSNCNDGLGYTNGFYFGSLEPLIKILKRFSNLENLLPTENDYEYLLKKTFLINNISRKITCMLFFKIRNNNKIETQGKIKQMENEKNPKIIKAIKKLKKEMKKI